MMRSLNLSGDLAEQILKERFEKSKPNSISDSEAIASFEDDFGPLVSCRAAYRLQRQYINRIIVDTVLEGLRPLYRKIALSKYKKKHTMMKISIDYMISIDRLSVIDKQLHSEISDMLFYVLRAKDVYNRLKVVNMLHILDMRLGFLQRCPDFSPYVNSDWLKSLEVCRMKYRNLFSMMDNILQQQESNMHCQVVGAKLRCPDYTSKDLSKLCHMSQNGVNRHLRTYEEDAMKFVLA